VLALLVLSGRQRLLSRRVSIIVNTLEEIGVLWLVLESWDLEGFALLYIRQ